MSLMLSDKFHLDMMIEVMNVLITPSLQHIHNSDNVHE